MVAETLQQLTGLPASLLPAPRRASTPPTDLFSLHLQGPLRPQPEARAPEPVRSSEEQRIPPSRRPGERRDDSPVERRRSEPRPAAREPSRPDRPPANRPGASENGSPAPQSGPSETVPSGASPSPAGEAAASEPVAETEESEVSSETAVVVPVVTDAVPAAVEASLVSTVTEVVPVEIAAESASGTAEQPGDAMQPGAAEMSNGGKLPNAANATEIPGELAAAPAAAATSNSTATADLQTTPVAEELAEQVQVAATEAEDAVSASEPTVEETVAIAPLVRSSESKSSQSDPNVTASAESALTDHAVAAPEAMDAQHEDSRDPQQKQSPDGTGGEPLTARSSFTAPDAGPEQPTSTQNLYATDVPKSGAGEPAADGATRTDGGPKGADGSTSALERLAPNLLSSKSRSAEAARAPGEVDPARFVQRIARAFRAAADRDGEIRLRLSPPELGSLKLELKVQGSALTARIEADNVHARNLLVEHLPMLRDRLSEQGIKVENFDVDLMQQQPDTLPQDQSESGAGESREQRNSHVLSGSRERDDVGEELVEASPRRLFSDGRLNVIV